MQYQRFLNGKRARLDIFAWLSSNLESIRHKRHNTTILYSALLGDVGSYQKRKNHHLTCPFQN
jgi:hypothetical protein